MRHQSPALLLICAVWLCIGCDTSMRMPPTPFVMLGEAGREQFAQTLPDLQTPEIPIVYFTDRLNLSETDEPVYRDKRSSTISFGRAVVTPSPRVTWDELVDASTSAQRRHAYTLNLTGVEERGRIRPVENLLEVVDGELIYTQEAWNTFIEDVNGFDAAIEPWLKPGNDNGVLVFVHGFNYSFADAALELAQVWHAAGRDGVPVLFSWPAGHGGFLPIAYNYDRESGEFSIRHLKILLYALANNDRVSRVHIVAHSRGTDVVVTTLREIKADMWGVYGGSGFSRLALGLKPGELIPPPGKPKSAPQTTKIKTLVLAAGDIDRDVFIQRFVVEQVPKVAARTVIYASRSDIALRAANIFFGDNRRLGQQTAEDFPPPVRDVLGKLPTIEFIECEVRAVHSHGYLFESPATVSDMIRLVRDGQVAGSPMRPLTPRVPGFWYLDNDYLRPDADVDDVPAALPLSESP